MLSGLQSIDFGFDRCPEKQNNTTFSLKISFSPIFKQNKENVIETLEEYINNLQQFKELMEKDDFSEIFNEMESTNYIKKILNGIK